MTKARVFLAVAFAGALAACASTYAPSSIVGGFSDAKMGSDQWIVSYGGNGYTTEETVQTYWLYHCAELALANGYDGFEILSGVKLTAVEPSDGARLIRISEPQRMDDYERSQKPWLDGRVRMLRKPLSPDPGRIFDARVLKARLEPYVVGTKCGGNVCPHVHDYLYPPAPVLN